jgi:hypothetical protein
MEKSVMWDSKITAYNAPLWDVLRYYSTNTDFGTTTDVQAVFDDSRWPQISAIPDDRTPQYIYKSANLDP